MTREITLTQGYAAIVDDADFETASAYKWYAKVARTGNVYAAREHAGQDNKVKTLFLHQLLMTPKDGFTVDHKDGNGLNCTRGNMRVCTHAENCRNRGRAPNNKSGYKGVHWDKSGRHRNKWRASICIDYKAIRLGRFSTAEDAARAYDAAARVHFGEFARTNF